MNGIGIDYQQTLSVLCLREGQGAVSHLRSVGDGLRHLIPNAALDEERWGSRALLSSAADGLRQGDPTCPGPWLDEVGSPIFWRGIAQRLYTYLSRVKPTRQHGFDVVTCLISADHQAAAQQVKQFCQEAALNDVMFIPATDALLCRWLNEHPNLPSEESVVTVAAIGDTATQVAAYRIQQSTLQPRVQSSSAPQCLPIGHATWMSRLLIQVHAQLSEPLSAGYDLALRDAALEYLKHLGRIGTTEELEWKGLLRERMYAPLRLSQQDCRSWPEAIEFLRALPIALRAALSQMSSANAPDMIVLGGIGALWPFVAEAAAEVGPLWRSAIPQEDLARGAACWSEASSHSHSFLGTQAGLLPTRSESVAALPDHITWDEAEGEAIEGEESSSDLIPPWKRHLQADY